MLNSDMKIKFCHTCDEDISHLEYEETRTRSGHSFCNYECFEAYFDDDGIRDDDDFICVKD